MSPLNVSLSKAEWSEVNRQTHGFNFCSLSITFSVCVCLFICSSRKRFANKIKANKEVG